MTVPNPTSRILKRGPGWRLGWDPQATEFPALVGSDDWALELTAAEWEDFCRLAQQLSETMQQMAAELMDEEAIACEAETPRLWLEAAGYPHAYSLRLILHTGRRGEGNWSAIATPALLQALPSLQVF